MAPPRRGTARCRRRCRAGRRAGCRHSRSGMPPRLRITVRQGADLRSGHRELIRVVEIRQRHRGSSHQRTVATCPAGQSCGDGGHLGSRPAAPGQHRARLDTDVRRVRVDPGHEVRRDAVESPALHQRLGDTEGHRRVVRPLAGRPVEGAAADHVDHRLGRGVAELVSSTQRVTGCGAEQERPRRGSSVRRSASCRPLCSFVR